MGFDWADLAGVNFMQDGLFSVGTDQDGQSSPKDEAEGKQLDASAPAQGRGIADL